MRLEDGTEVIGVDDFGYYSSRRGRTEWRLVEADSDDFRYQGSSGEAVKVYRWVSALTLESKLYLRKGAWQGCQRSSANARLDLQTVRRSTPGQCHCDIENWT